jgi:Leucine-rich repeat (LRR) protein
MTALRDLYLEQNFVKRMPDSFTCLTTLVMLRLSANRLMELPNNLGQIMPSLSEMWVENNRLRALPDSLGYFTTLHLLVAHTNKVQCSLNPPS